MQPKGKKGRAAALLLAVVLGACAEAPTAPEAGAITARAMTQPLAKEGTGLVLQSLTGVTLPLIGRVGTVDVDQAVITNLVLVEDVVGNIVGLEAEGVLTITGGVLGKEVISEDFLTQVKVASSGPGKCDVLTVDLGPIGIDALGAVSVDALEAAVTPRSSGAVGSLLCNLGKLLQPPVSGVTSAVRGLVNAINRII
jgi:hypothetical protein